MMIDKDTDTYEDSLGYMNMYNKVEAVIYNKELGRVETKLYQCYNKIVIRKILIIEHLYTYVKVCVLCYDSRTTDGSENTGAFKRFAVNTYTIELKLQLKSKSHLNDYVPGEYQKEDN